MIQGNDVGPLHEHRDPVHLEEERLTDGIGLGNQLEGPEPDPGARGVHPETGVQLRFDGVEGLLPHSGWPPPFWVEDGQWDVELVFP